MGELVSYLGIAVRIFMVIAGILAVVALFSGKRPRASNREIKIALVLVLGVLIIIAVALLVAAKYA
jgi:predicted membrane channel-forming protein YqfA (hemolysin III family)